MTKKWAIRPVITVLVIVLLSAACGPSEVEPPPDHMTVQLKWVNQAQFAGFYVAKEQGYYAEQNLDVTVSSLGDAKSLRGGTLILTPMRGADREVYAVAQGPLSVGGYTASGGGSSAKSGHTTVGRIPGGAIMEREIATSITKEKRMGLSLKDPDAKVAAAIAAGINGVLEGEFARASDPGMVELTLPDAYRGREVELLATIGDLEIDRGVSARIIINERTGTVVVGGAVRLRPAAIAHGGLIVQISQTKVVSQPPPFSVGGTTEVVEETQVEVENVPGDLHDLPATATVSDLVNALNALGVKPADLIVIFQSLAAAGAITASVEVQ